MWLIWPGLLRFGVGDVFVRVVVDFVRAMGHVCRVSCASRASSLARPHRIDHHYTQTAVRWSMHAGGTYVLPCYFLRLQTSEYCWSTSSTGVSYLQFFRLHTSVL